MKFLTFLMAGPMQSYGEISRWDMRDTSSMPTKSAVIGLLGCVMGLGRGDGGLEELSRKLRLAVRADCAGRVMTDFHTVQGPGGVIRNAEHKNRGSTIITCKQYLQDAAFQAFLWGDVAALEACRAAMLHPRWAAYLGRRGCPPAYPLVPRVVEYPSVEDALERYFERNFTRARDEEMLCEIELDSSQIEERALIRMDEPIRADRDVYDSRRVRVVAVKDVEKRCS